MEISRNMAAGMLAATLSIGGVAGAVLLDPAGAAQDPEVTTTTADDSGTAPATGDDVTVDGERPAPPEGMAGRRGVGHGPGRMLDEVAEAIGIDAEDLRSALADGQTIAEVAEANGVDLDTLTDALVASGTERLEEAIANLPDRVDDLVNRSFEDLGERGPGRHGPGAPDVDGDVEVEDDGD